MTPVITTLRMVPPFARGFVRDLRARWACEEEGIGYEMRLIDHPETKRPDHRREQPFGQVPTYADDEVHIFESGAIMLRIAELGSTLLPKDANGRFGAIQWMFAALNSIEPYVMQRVTVDLIEADEPWSALRRPRVMADLAARLAGLAEALGDKSWLDGDAFTVGDLAMIAVLANVRGTDLLASLPNLAAYVARGEARPAHRKALADQLALYDSPAEA